MGFDPAAALACIALPMLAAYGAMLTHDFPMREQRRFNMKAISAFRRVKSEADALRNALDATETRMRDLRATSAGIDEGLRQRVQRLPARDQSALNALLADGSFTGLLAILKHGLLVDRRVAELQRAWNPARGTGERESTRLLCENLWLMEPDLVSDGHVFTGKTLGAIAGAYFHSDLDGDDLSVMAARKKPSAAGVFHRRSGVVNDRDPGERILAIIEARRPGDEITRAVVDACLGYAHGMRKLAPGLRDWTIECWIVGGKIAEDAHVAAHGAPPGTAVHVATWTALLNRAKTRRPETVDLRSIRFDADRPPNYPLAGQTEQLSSFLDMEVEREEIASAGSGHGGGPSAA